MKLLFAWLGVTDLRASSSGTPEFGPIASALKALEFDRLILLADHDSKSIKGYVTWLSGLFVGDVELHQVKLTSPTNHQEIYISANQVIAAARLAYRNAQMTFHLSPGTPAMAAIWLLLAKTKYDAELIESSREQGVRTVLIPFDLAAEFTPLATRQADDALARLVQGLPPAFPEFSSIIHRCNAMKRVIAMAYKLSRRDVPVLIQGESGTGKELFARAIHASSVRRGAPFVAVNCGAIPSELIDSELFGHEKGSFTGANSTRLGHFETADGGTLFLDEIGELPLSSQVRLLRVLQEREITRLGASKSRKIDVRIIAATNRVLPDEIREGRFREDVFHRIAVGVLVLPPLREREGDLSLLIDALLAKVNEEAATQPEYKHKKLSVDARNIMFRHSWPGNVRELNNAILRASIWASGEEITAADVVEALALTVRSKTDSTLDRALGEAFSLPDLIGDVARHYLEMAMHQSNGNKSEAAKLLGLGSYQTLTNWLNKYLPKQPGTDGAL
jgi:transcriptional regulator with PAS, ATPase and Fis domain